MGNRSHIKLVDVSRLQLRPDHLAILKLLAENSATPAWVFEEKPLDELFKARPRYVRLVRGHENAVVEITSEGLQAYTEATRGRAS